LASTSLSYKSFLQDPLQPYTRARARELPRRRRRRTKAFDTTNRVCSVPARAAGLAGEVQISPLPGNRERYIPAVGLTRDGDPQVAESRASHGIAIGIDVSCESEAVRCKSLKRFKGWGYKTHGDGWRLDTDDTMRHGHLRPQGVGWVRLRGGSRTPGTPKTCDIPHRHGKWYASITIACQPERPGGHAILGCDWGVETSTTLADADSACAPVAHPRFLQRAEDTLQAAYRERDHKQKGSKAWQGVSAEDSRRCQTSTASPAKPGGSLCRLERVRV